MPPKPYYDIQPEAYLFGKKEEKPEEKVRQWALFELLSTYGVSINNIKIEGRVRVGTRTHRADIVILRDGFPEVIIECKKRKDKKLEKGMDQALSYADANQVRAKFAIYTNGDIWRVKRKIGREWVDIPDLPKTIGSEIEVRIDELISSINDFMPALYWLNRSVPAGSAKMYFNCLQRLFHSQCYPLNSDNLISAI